MVQSILTLRSSIKPKALRKALLQGVSLGGSGAILLLYAASTYTPTSLVYWGLPIFILGMVLIAWGFHPYKQLRKLEENPNKLIVDDQNNLRFIHEGKVFVVIPVSAISKITYLDYAGEYGIVIHLHNGKEGKIHARKQTDKNSNSLRLWHKQGKRALFLPYFSEKAFQLLNKNVTIEEEKESEEFYWDKYHV